MHHLLRVRGHYYYNARVPKDVQNIVRLQRIKASLHTKNLKHAKVLAKSFSYKLETIYTYARTGIMTDEQIQRIMGNFLRETLRNFEEGRASGVNAVQSEDTLMKMIKVYELMGNEDTESLKYNKLEDIQGWLDDTLEEQGVAIDKGSLDYRILCREALKTRIELWKIESERLKGNYDNDYDKFMRNRIFAHGRFPQVGKAQGSEATEAGIKLSELIDKFMEFKVTFKKSWTPRTKIDMQGILNRLLKILGNIDVKTLNATSAEQYASALHKYPNKVHPQDKDKPLDEIMRIAKEKGSKILGVKTLKKNFETVSTMMQWAFDKDYISKNFFIGLAPKDNRKDDEKRQPYSIEELLRLFSLPIFTTKIPVKRPEWFFIPLLALFTGMRSDEMCQLYCDDIKVQLDIDYIHVMDDKDKKLKTPRARRLIPIHPVLKQIGFLDYVERIKEAGHERLWSNLHKNKYGAYNKAFESWYSKLNRKEVTPNDRVTFHSLRHNFEDTLKQKLVLPEIADEITGHEGRTGSPMRRIYTEPFKLPILWEAIQKLEYDELDFSEIRFPMELIDTYIKSCGGKANDIHDGKRNTEGTGF